MIEILKFLPTTYGYIFKQRIFNHFIQGIYKGHVVALDIMGQRD